MIHAFLMIHMLGTPDPIGYLQTVSIEDRRRLLNISYMDILSTGCNGPAGSRSSIYDDQRRLTHLRDVVFLAHLSKSRHLIIRVIAALELIHQGTPEAERALAAISTENGAFEALGCCIGERYDLADLCARGKDPPLYRVYYSRSPRR